MVRRRPLLVALIVMGLWGSSAPAAAQAADPGLRQLTEQGVHYYKKRRVEAAVESLEQARRLPGGEKDYQLLSTLARAYYDLELVEKAIPTASEAVLAARGESETQEAERFLESLNQSYGGVTFVAVGGGDGRGKGGMELAESGQLIHPKKKKIFERISRRVAEQPVDLPLTLYLPFGRYEANGREFEVQPGKVVEVPVHLREAGDGDSSVATWWYVGAGAALLAGAGVAVAIVAASGEPETEQVLRVDEVRFLAGPGANASGTGR